MEEILKIECEIPKNWDINVVNLIEKLSFNGFVLAGNSVANIIEGIPLKGDLDFWVSNSEDYLKILSEFPGEKYEIYYSMVNIINKDLPNINLVYKNCSPEETIKKFDFDYCRCFYNKKGTFATKSAILSINEKRILNYLHNGKINPRRIHKAIKYGYSFTKEYQNIELPIYEEINFNITNYENITDTFKEIIETYNKNRGKKNIKFLPFLTITKDKYEFVEKYIEETVLNNPLKSANYENPDENTNGEKNVTSDEEIQRIEKYDNENPFKIQNFSHISISELSQNLSDYSLKNFNEMFNLHPEERHKIIMYEKEIEVHRFQKSYLKTPKIDKEYIKSNSYMYSGYNDSNNSQELPEIFRPFYDFVKERDIKYNQVIINWYEKNDYISMHSDCIRSMKTCSPILIISIYEDISHSVKLTIENKNSKLKYEKELNHGSIIEMFGNFQKEFRHGILNNPNKRISISFRQMEEN